MFGPGRWCLPGVVISFPFEAGVFGVVVGEVSKPIGSRNPGARRNTRRFMVPDDLSEKTMGESVVATICSAVVRWFLCGT
jgi:hypothetical protein